MIQTQMQLEGRFLAVVVRPWEHLHRHINQRGIQGKEFAFESKAMAALVARATLIQGLEQGFVEPIIHILIGTPQRRSADGLIAQVISVVALGAYGRFDVSQARAPTQLANGQSNEL